jgi:hypothetical protein
MLSFFGLSLSRRRRRGLVLLLILTLVFRNEIVVIVAGRVWESGKPDFGFPLFQARPA